MKQNPDLVCTLVPYFEVAEGRMDEFRALGPRFVARTRQEPGCAHYAFSYQAPFAHCREGYIDGEAVLAHLSNVGDILNEALTMARIIRLEVHGPAAELDRLRGPLAALNPTYYTLADGFRAQVYHDARD